MDQQQLRNFSNLRLTGDEYSTLSPINELDKNPGRLSAGGAEDETTPYKSSNQFQQTYGNKKATPYTYDKSGQLEWNAGCEKQVIEDYLCELPLYRERTKSKYCGLVLWIQRAPPITGPNGGTPPLCLFKDCQVNQSRHIQAGDIRIAFDEKTALGLEPDPQINAGYVHLKCLEALVPYHRQMFAKLNFKVEGRGPHKTGSWLYNPTIFTTMGQIIYAEDYIEDCRNGGRTSDTILLSAGIEKELRSTHPAVREIVSKILEMEGWGDLKAWVDLTYAQACGTTLARKEANRPNREGYTKIKRHSSRDEISTSKKAKERAGQRDRYEYSHIKESRPNSSEPFKRRHEQQDLSSKEAEPNVTTGPQPLKSGEGKIKSRLFMKDGKMVWEDYEDPWSPLVSDLEDATEDDDDSNDEDPWSPLVSDLEDAIEDDDDSNDEDPWSPLVSDLEDATEDDDDSNGDEDSGDNELWSENEPRGRKRMRSESEDDSEENELMGGKRKRV